MSAKTVKNDKNGWKASVKMGKDVKKEGCLGFSNAGKSVEEKVLKSVSQNA